MAHRWMPRKEGSVAKIKFMYADTLGRIAAAGNGAEPHIEQVDQLIDLMGRAETAIRWYFGGRRGWLVTYSQLHDDLHPFTADELIPALDSLVEVGFIEATRDNLAYRRPHSSEEEVEAWIEARFQCE